MISTNSINFLMKMNGRKLIVSYICMLQIIFIHLTGSYAAKVSITQNITGFVGNKDIPLTCSFFIEKGEHLFSLQIKAKGITEDFDDNKLIAIFEYEAAATLHRAGKYLSGKVTLTNITTTSTNATMLFHKLKCEDEKDYICKLWYYNMDGFISHVRSEATRILVQANPCRPDGISRCIVSSIITDTQATSNILRGANITSTRTNQNSSTSFPTLPSFREGLTFIKSQRYIREGDILMFTCTGNIGNPPGKLLWQKISLQHNRPMTYDNITTYVEEIRDNCTFKGTSNLTVQIYAEDFQARIRCFEESQANVPGMYIETEPLDVHLDEVLQSESESMQFFAVHAAFAVSFICTVVVVILCCAIRKLYCNREKKNVHSDDQENIYVNNNYAETGRISYQEVNPHNDRIENSNQPITKEEIVLKNIHTSTCTSSSESIIPLSHLYVNTDIFNTIENRKVPSNHGPTSDYLNEFGNCNIRVDNMFYSNNSESDTLYVNQYVNTNSLRVSNVYEDVNHTTVDTHTYESPHVEGSTTCTE